MNDHKPDLAQEIIDLWTNEPDEIEQICQEMERKHRPESEHHDMDPDPLYLYYGLSRQLPYHGLRIEWEDRIKPRQDQYVYVLIDPESNDVRYVGKTNDVFSRALEHCSGIKPHNHMLAAWIDWRIQEGEPPIMRVIDQCSYRDWEETEDFWIDHYAERSDLFNQVKNCWLK